MFIPDPRWEEPNLLIPGKKPTGPVVVDWSHPLARGLVYTIAPKLYGGVDVVNKDKASAVGTPTAIYNARHGEGLYSNSSHLCGCESSVTTGDLGIDGANPKTVLVIAGSEDGTTNLNRRFFSMGGTASYNPFELSITGWSNTALVRLEMWNLRLESTSYIPDISNKTYAVSATYDGSTVKIFFNGGEENSSTGVTLTTTDTALRVNKEMYGTTIGTDGGVYWVALWNRALSASEIAEISRNPYQFLIPA